LNNSEPKREPYSFSIVIPAYNEQDGIQAIIERVVAIQPSLVEIGIENLDLIVVDDGSSDRTSEIVASCPSARLIRHTTNKGYGAALKTGFQAAAGDLVGFLDADGTYPPEYFPILCRAAMDGADLVVGSRRSGASSEMPFLRRFGNLIWSSLVSLLSGQRVADPASGMRVFHAEVLRKLYPLPDGLNFTPVMSTRAVHEGVRLVEVPIPYKERLGQSKLNVITDGLRFLRTIIWTALNYNPARILGGIGLIMMGLAALITIVLVSFRLSGVTTLGPVAVTAAFVAVVLGIGGVDIFAMGITFNYLVSLFHKRQLRQSVFGRPLFKTPLENHFWWIGLLLLLAGVVIGLTSFVLAMDGWPVIRLWLYLLAGTMLILIGIQLVIFWIIMQVLEELSQREIQMQSDLEAR
jgi:glycosyltransferase involved in cell wall biosynthesis